MAFAQRVLNARMIRVNACWYVPSVGGRHHEIRREGTVAVNPKNGAVFANVRIAFIAPRTGPTRQVAFNGDEVAHGMGINTLTQRHHVPAGFMTRDGAQGHVITTPSVPFPDVDVRATNGRGFGSNENLSRARGRDGVLLLSESSNLVASFGPRRHARWYG